MNARIYAVPNVHLANNPVKFIVPIQNVNNSVEKHVINVLINVNINVNIQYVKCYATKFVTESHVYIHV